MTQLEEAVGGNDEPVIEAEPTLEDRFAALSDDDQEEEQPEEQPEGEPDEPVVEDDAAEEIAPPVSWKDDEKAEFAALPRKQQEIIARREAERERFVQSKSHEAREAKLAAQRETTEKFTAMQKLFQQQVQAVLPPIPPEPSAHLQVSDPYAFANAVEARKAAIRQHQIAQAQNQQLTQAQQAQEKALKEQEEAASLELLRDNLPEYFEDHGGELRQALRSTALELGYTEEKVEGVDGADVLALHKARQWKDKADKYDALMAKKMEGVRAAKSLPRVSRPGAAQPKGAAANARYTADRKAMMAGDDDAAARVFGRFI